MASKKLVFLIILIVGCLTQFASDIYAPSLPGIAKDLTAPIHSVQLSMAIYLFGVAFSILIYGPISEGYGRKPPLLVGLIILLAGTLICLFASNVNYLIVGRLIQGFGAGAGGGLWRAIFRDVFSGKQLAKYASYMTIFVMFFIPAAPAFGGYLHHFFGWRSVFVAISIYSLIAILSVFFLFKETSKHHHKERLKAKYIRTTFRELFSDRTFLGITMSVFLTYGGFFSWFVASPVLLIHRIGISAVDFGWLNFLGGGAAFAIGGWINSRCVSRFGMPTMMRFGWGMMFFSGILLMLGKFIIGLNLWAIFIPSMLFYFATTLVWPNAFATALTPFGKIAGYAGPSYSFMQLAGGAAIGALVAKLPAFNQLPLAIVFIVTALLSWLVYEIIVNRRVK